MYWPKQVFEADTQYLNPAFIPVTAAVTSLFLSALPRTLSSLGSETLMLAADRAKARTR
jgi:hypothetical protein